jgi:Tol biopolymer transport system component
MQPSRRALRWLFVAFSVVFVGGTLLFLGDDRYRGRGLYYMCASSFSLWMTWRMWKGERLSPFLRSLPIRVFLPALALFLVISGVIDLVHDRPDDGYIRLGGAVLTIGVFAFVLYRSIKEARRTAIRDHETSLLSADHQRSPDLSVEVPPPSGTPPMVTRASATGFRTALILTVVFVGSVTVAYPTLRPYPPATAWLLLVLATLPIAALGYVVGSRNPAAVRPAGLAALVLLAAVVPWAMVRWVPGVTQPAEHPIPGAPAIVVSAAPDGNWDLYLLPDGDSSNRVALTNTPGDQERFPQLSPVGSRLVYGLLQPDGTYDLYLMELDGTRQVSNDLLLAGPGDLTDTSWSPDGTRLLVRSGVEGEGSRIYLLELATGSLQPILDNASNPEWSPDGSRVVYVGYRREAPGNADIFVAGADGSEPQAVVDTGNDDYFPSWSPEGGEIAFTSRVDGGDQDVFVVDVSGGHLRNLTADSPDSEETYGWTPGGRILFLSDRSRTGGTFMYFMDPDGSDVRLAQIL